MKVTKNIATLFAGSIAKRDAAARESLALVPAAKIDAWLETFRGEAAAFGDLTLRDRLDALRNHLGEVHYHEVASGPSLDVLLSRWAEAEKKSIANRSIDRLITLPSKYKATPSLGRQEAAAYFGRILLEGDGGDS